MVGAEGTGIRLVAGDSTLPSTLGEKLGGGALATEGSGMRERLSVWHVC